MNIPTHNLNVKFLHKSSFVLRCFYCNFIVFFTFWIQTSREKNIGLRFIYSFLLDKTRYNSNIVLMLKQTNIMLNI